MSYTPGTDWGGEIPQKKGNKRTGSSGMRVGAGWMATGGGKGRHWTEKEMMNFRLGHLSPYMPKEGAAIVPRD
jgi:hypothetical protein